MSKLFLRTATRSVLLMQHNDNPEKPASQTDHRLIIVSTMPDEATTMDFIATFFTENKTARLAMHMIDAACGQETTVSIITYLRDGGNQLPKRPTHVQL